MYFCKVEDFAYGEINEWSFSNLHPWQFIRLWANGSTLPELVASSNVIVSIECFNGNFPGMTVMSVCVIRMAVKLILFDINQFLFNQHDLIWYQPVFDQSVRRVKPMLLIDSEQSKFVWDMQSQLVGIKSHYVLKLYGGTWINPVFRKVLYNVGVDLCRHDIRWKGNVVVLAKFSLLLYRKLSTNWQLPMQPMMKTWSKWRHFCFDVERYRREDWTNPSASWTNFCCFDKNNQQKSCISSWKL